MTDRNQHEQPQEGDEPSNDQALTTPPAFERVAYAVVDDANLPEVLRALGRGSPPIDGDAQERKQQ